MSNPIITIIVIGDEILSGKTLDSNSHFISQQLYANGYSVRSVSIVGDDEADVVDIIRRYIAISDVVVITGGLGPTPDDMTRFAVSKAIGKKLRLFPKEVTRIHKRLQFASKRIRKISEIEAYLPENAIPIRNTVGLAPGFRIAFQNCSIFCIPGVPQEAEAMLQKTILPYIEKCFKPSKELHYICKTIGIGESELYRRIKPYLYSSIRVGFYPKGREVELRLHAVRECKKELDCAYAMIQKELHDYVYATVEINIVEAIARILVNRRLTIAVAESCTGGLISKRITDVSGSTLFYCGSIVAYSNILKEQLLHVKSITLKKYGAVSAQVVRQMARGLSSVVKADLSLSISGIAGPTGGTKKKPVGLVFIGVHFEGKTRVRKYQFKGNREKVRWLASQAAFQFVWDIVR